MRARDGKGAGYVTDVLFGVGCCWIFRLLHASHNLLFMKVFVNLILHCWPVCILVGRHYHFVSAQLITAISPQLTCSSLAR